MDEIKQFVMQSIRKRGTIPKGVSWNTFNYFDSGVVDSMEIIKFVLELESRFDVEILESDMESEPFRTIGGLVAMIHAKRNPNTSQS